MRAHTRGFTVVELALVLMLLGITTASVAPAARRQRDRAAVVGAREAVVALFAEARTSAMATGAASVRLTADPARAEVVSRARILRTAEIAEDFGVSLHLGGSSLVEIPYDAMGLGRVASQTIAFARGDEATQLIVSGYGRVRRR